MLIFVFAGVSCGEMRAILAEFAPVPNVPSAETPVSANSCVDVRAPADYPTPAVPIAVNKRVEVGGPTGPEPTRFGDWERNGRCVDF
jgi:hypothetical protein